MNLSEAPKRSRAGCSECRRRRRKCDEAKPRCKACLSHGRHCSYEIRLSWGGRPFERSRFGDCVQRSRDLRQIYVSTNSDPEGRSFVYGSLPRSRSPSLNTDDLLSETQNCKSQSVNHGWPALMLDPQDEQQSPFPYDRTSAPNYNYMEDFSYTLDGLGPIPTSQRSLLHHFAVYTSMSISCHDSIRESFCKELIPVAVQSSLVLFALLNLAARHRESLGLSTNTTERNFLQSRSMALLLATLSDENRKDDDELLATILILCMCDIVSRGDQPSSWRLHLQGARAMVSAHLGEGSRQHPPKLRSLLWRWYLSIESLSLLSGATETVSYSRTALQLRHYFGDSEIDILSGFSIALIPVFAEIHLLIIERNSNARRKYHSQPSSAPGLYLVTERARILIDNVRSMLAKKCPKLASPREHTFDARARSDFIALDEAYHHVALLHLYRRVLRIPVEDNIVQQCVSRIIDLISAMTFEAEPCPGVAVLQPIFTAGCEAIEQSDKDNIRLVLNRIERCFGMGNVKSVRMFLENMWHVSSSREQSQGHVIWDDLMLEKRLDILPY